MRWNGAIVCSTFAAGTTYSVEWTTSNTTMPTPEEVDDLNQHLKNMRNWNVTLHGQVDGQKKPVPHIFQDAFKDGELEP